MERPSLSRVLRKRIHIFNVLCYVLDCCPTCYLISSFVCVSCVPVGERTRGRFSAFSVSPFFDTEFSNGAGHRDENASKMRLYAHSGIPERGDSSGARDTKHGNAVAAFESDFFIRTNDQKETTSAALRIPFSGSCLRLFDLSERLTRCKSVFKSDSQVVAR